MATTMTERSLADSKTWSIKQTINQSGLDFILSESPFSISVKIRKRFLLDRSQEISPPPTRESNLDTFPLSSPTNHKDSKFKGMEQEINRLKIIIDEKDDTIKDITKTKEKDLKALQTSSDQKTLQIQNLNSEINQNHETNSSSQKQLKTLKDNLAASQKQLQTTQDKLTNSLEQLQTTKNDLSNSQKHLQTTKEQQTNLTKQLQSTKDKLDKAQKESQSTKDKLTDLQKQLQTTKDKSDTLADSLKQLQSTKDKLIDYQKQLHTSKESLKESNKQIQNLNKEIKKNSENLLKYKSQLQQKSDALLQCETDLKTTKDNFLDSQNQLNNNDELLNCKTELETTKEKLSLSQNQFKTMKILADKAESKCLEKDQKLKLMEKDFEDRLVNSQSNVKATKAKPAYPQRSFKWTSPDKPVCKHYGCRPEKCSVKFKW